MRKIFLLLMASLALCPSMPAQTSFSGLDLSPADRLLFKASTRSPDYGSYDTLFSADVRTKALRELTFFPEEVLLLQEKAVLQIQNRFGVFRSDPGFGNISPLLLFPAFVSGSQIQTGKIAPMQTSPNGRYLLYIRPRSAAHGDLTLLDVAKGQEVVLSDQVEISVRELPAAWSPGSRFLVYAKSSSLFYFSLDQLDQGRVLTEGLRRLGEGRIANVRWGAGGTLFYLSGSVVYAIDPAELFTRALYAGFLSIGRVSGRIPFGFDANFDRFWVAPDGEHLLLDKDGRNIFLFDLTVGDFHGGDAATLPYLYLPRDTTLRKVLWSSSGVLTILCESRNAGKKGSSIFRLTPASDGAPVRFTRTADAGVTDFALSPDQATAALMKDTEIVVKDYTAWKDTGRIAHPSPLHLSWLDDDELLVAGALYTARYPLPSGTPTVVALSQPGDYGYAAEGDAVQTRVAGSAYTLDEKNGTWSPTPAFRARAESASSGSYRVYLEDSKRGSYANLIMVRDAKGYGTVSLIPAETTPYEAFPAEDEPVDFRNFTHGSRIRRREVSLVFNAVDSAEGLTGVLNVLSAFGLRATFFVNGEFIRRYPDAVKEIADSGHEVGSLYSMYFNMTDARFKVDREFIKAGLARNEDDYNTATGRELSLLWHAPYYIVNSEIIEAGRQMNYTYVGRDIDTYDWVANTDTNREMGIYQPAAALVEKVVAEKKPGSVIPLLVGTGEGEREDYLFQKLDLLVNELVKLGYNVVPVSTMIEHAR